ncbi:MAG: hypothetical protein ABW000_22225 [Actinoplanes sp.]
MTSPQEERTFFPYHVSGAGGRRQDRSFCLYGVQRAGPKSGRSAGQAEAGRGPGRIEPDGISIRAVGGDKALAEAHESGQDREPGFAALAANYAQQTPGLMALRPAVW